MIHKTFIFNSALITLTLILIHESLRYGMCQSLYVTFWPATFAITCFMQHGYLITTTGISTDHQNIWWETYKEQPRYGSIAKTDLKNLKVTCDQIYGISLQYYPGLEAYEITELYLLTLNVLQIITATDWLYLIDTFQILMPNTSNLCCLYCHV